MARPEISAPRRHPHRPLTAAARAVSAVELVTEFAHELRTPLSATLLWVQLLHTRTSPDPALLREGLEAITSAAHEQQTLIEQLVLVAQVLAGRVELARTPVRLAAFTRRVAAPWQARALDRGIDFQLVVDAEAGTGLVDATRLQRILDNLLDNAERFTPRSGRITLELAREGDFTVWRVKDTGPGIAAPYLPHLFQLHPKARPPAQRTTTGLGVSLFIADQLVALHDGTLDARSGGAPAGTVFTVRLPSLAGSPD
jgi:signal transduction histidine kinase